MHKKIAIQLDQVSKSFPAANLSITANLLSYLSSQKQLEVLRQISATIHAGEVVGLVGPNGSGKSTLLRLIAGIYHPNSGVIRTQGKVVAVVDLYAGFHPALSVWQNIQLKALSYGSSLGLQAGYCQKVLLFAELTTYRDAPLEHLSSGMKARLAFASSIYLPYDILLLDEVFSVGDANFIDKSGQFIRDLKGKKTIIISSHNLQLLAFFCDRVIRLDQGRQQTNLHLAGLLHKIQPGASYHLRVATNSMYPYIQRGETVSVKMKPFNQVKVGEVVVLYIETIDEIITHRVLSVVKNGQQFILKGDNAYTPDTWILTKDNYLGVVKLLQRGRKIHS